MSPYTEQTVWEVEYTNQIYDSMLAVDPNTGGLCQTQPGGSAHCVDWLTTSHGATANTPVTGQTTWTWNLRADTFFTDGVQLTAHDVCFSILSYRDAPSAPFFASVSNVVSCTAVSDRIAQVVVTGNSPFTELNLGGVYILPEHVWAPICGGLQTGTDRCVTPSNLASTSFDPVAAGDMVGSSAWVCNKSVGVSTIAGQASCTQNANGSPGGQALAAGARILLKRNTGWFRCCDDMPAAVTPWLGTANHGSNLQALEWANVNKNGKVTISDIAVAATVFGQSATASLTAAYFAHPFYSANPSARTVDIGDIAVAAFYFDHGITAPFVDPRTSPFNTAAPTGLTQYATNTDPYLTPVIGGFYYFQGATGSGMTLTVNIDACANCHVIIYQDVATGGNTQLKWDRGDNQPNQHIPVAASFPGVGVQCTPSPAGWDCPLNFALPYDIEIYQLNGTANSKCNNQNANGPTPTLPAVGYAIVDCRELNSPIN
jgi:hypothetical protein